MNGFYYAHQTTKHKPAILFRQCLCGIDEAVNYFRKSNGCIFRLRFFRDITRICQHLVYASDRTVCGVLPVHI